MKEKLKLVESHMLRTYKPQLITSDMVEEVIIHDAYDRFLYKPTEVEVKWLVAKLRFSVADAALKEQIKKQDDEAWMNWIYSK